MKTLRWILLLGVITPGLALFSGCGTTLPANQGQDVRSMVVAPPWAPPYDDSRLVRYYYLPDLEVYYDVRGHAFVCRQNGNWAFMRSLPPAYAGVDLSTTFVVVLDSRASEPWMRHPYYIAHYPPNYYNAMYHVSDAREVRGFNENRGIEIRRPGDKRVPMVRAVPPPPVSTILPPGAREPRKAETTQPQPPVRNLTLPVAREAQKAAPAESQPPVHNMALPVAREAQKAAPAKPQQRVHHSPEKTRKNDKVEPQKSKPRDKQRKEK